MSNLYSAEVLADSPIAYWRLGEAPGSPPGSVAGFSAIDASGNSNHGTYQASNTWGGYTNTPIVDDPDTCVFFNGASNSYVSVPHNATLNFGDTFSYELWIKRNSTGALMYLMGKGSTSPFLEITAGNVIELDKYGTVGAVITSSITITDANWHHIVVTKTGSTRKLYIDGVDRTTLGTNQTMASTALAFGIAQPGPNLAANSFNGWIDEAAVYNTALTQTRVQAHYNTALAANATGVERAGMAII